MPYESVDKISAGNVLVLAPHPDDEVFGCAGAIMRHVEANDLVSVVVVSDGGYLESESVESYIELRKQESIQAGVLLGYVPEFWAMPDRNVQYGEKLICRISDTIRSLDIDVVYAPSVSEMHPDHRSLGMAVAEAVRRSDKIVTVAFYEIGIPLRPNCLLDISDLVQRKQQAMECFPSQLKQQQYDEQITALNRFRSYTLPESVQSAEAYFISNSEELSEHPLSLYHPEIEKIKFPGLEIDASNGVLVTVMIRSMDRGFLLQEALDSVALQTYPNIEVLVVNAKGAEHSQLGGWCGRFPLRICGSGEQLNRSKAANMVLKESKGDFLIFLDDDDLFYPDHIANLMQKLGDSPGSLVAYAGVITLGGEDTCALTTFNSPFNALQLLVGNYIPIHAVLFHRCFVDSGCHFDEQMNIYEDWDFWIQLSQQTKFIHVDKISAQYRIFDGGSDVQLNSEATDAARLSIYHKWKSRWSDKELLGLMQLAYEKKQIEEAFSIANAELQVKEATINNLQAYLEERGLSIAQLQESAGTLHNELHDKCSELACLQHELAEKEAVINEKEASIVVLQDEIHRRGDELQRRGEEVSRFLNSRPWRLTAEFRKGYRIFVTKPVRLLRQYSSNVVRSLWMNMPVRIDRKLAVKRALFKSLPTLFRHTLAYQHWQGSTGRQRTEPGNNVAPVISTHDMVNKHQKTYVSLLEADPFTSSNIRLIAFYLPQFHPIPENNEWWGEGFTEWTNVKPAEPQFTGHYQPHIPGELGYYDLCENDAAQERQVALAKLYGLEGFCFYFYWFDGKRLLEDPVQKYLDNKSLDLPFCLCWANENWSRRWDGLDSEILIGQNHSEEDDLAFIAYISKYMLDGRYIRIDGKPLLLVYRPSLLPSPKKTAERWRQWCRDSGLGEIYLAYTQSFEAVDPKKYGFDAAIEFPPNRAGVPPLPTDDLELLNDDFSGVLYDLGAVAERSRNYPKPGYTLFRGVCPAWDNTARRKGNGTIFVNSSPAIYQEWLYHAALDTASRFEQRGESLVFVNAWNEWAEGAHLEPDQADGYAYLQATRDALVNADARLNSRRILLVAHDAHPHGAQSLILHMAKVLSEQLYYSVDMVVLGDGILLDEYAKYATIHSLIGKKHGGKEAIELVAGLYARGLHSAICNTTVTGLFAKTLKEQGFRVVALIHELTSVIKNNQLQSCVQAMIKYADCTVFPALQVQQGFESFSSDRLQHAMIRPQGLFRKNSLNTLSVSESKKQLNEKLGLADGSKIVLSIAFADHRKGIDLFVEAGLQVVREMEKVYFVWVGHFDASVEQKIRKRLDNSGYSDHFIFPGMDFQSDLYYAGADLYALTSREDPFPSVVLEALNASTPVIAFEGAGGFDTLISRGAGSLISAFDTDAYAKEMIHLLKHPEIIRSQGAIGKEIVENEFSFRRYLFDLLRLSESSIKRVSVIVPNYNYARYLLDRIRTIVNQTYPIYELIILDDASSDESVELLEELIPSLDVDVKFVPSEKNSGNPFVQWMKGVELAQGDYVWVAEADDLSSLEFLDEVMIPFSDASVVMSYCQSKQISGSGEILSEHYLDYVSDISTNKWLDSYTNEGVDEVKSALAIKNTIPNVSGVVFSRDVLFHVLKENIDEIKTYRVAGDWLTYLLVLEAGKLAFSCKALNLHRRHKESITLGSFNIIQLTEVLSVQKRARESFHPDPGVVETAQSYAQHLYETFGLATDEAPVLREDPKLNVYLEETL